MSDCWQVEMLWRCTSCKAKNRGRELMCAGCGGPKDGSETYEMPSDVSRASAIADPALVRLASAGENWSCAYCASDQRRLDGGCARCGAGRPVAAARAATAVSRHRTPSSRKVWIGAAVAVVLVLFFMVKMRRKRPPPSPPQAVVVAPAFRDVDGEVTKRAWRTSVTVERNQLWPFEGFAETKPLDAVEVKDLGPRHHHDDSVLDGYVTQTWTENVADGYDTESYTASEACGQNCTSKPQNCQNVCTSGKNGFANCKNVCSGGGQTCTTKYCSVSKTRQVPRYKSVTKSKEVPRYRKVPRDATWYSWKAMAWKSVRVLDEKGTDEAPFFPSPEKIALGKDERAQKLATYEVTVAYESSELVYRARDEAELLALPKGTRMKVRVYTYGAAEIVPAR